MCDRWSLHDFEHFMQKYLVFFMLIIFLQLLLEALVRKLRFHIGII